MLEKGKFLFPSSPNPEPSNSKFYEKKFYFLHFFFSFSSVLSPSICKIEEVQDNTWFYWSTVKYAIFALKTLASFSHNLIHNLSHVQVWQRVLNQSYIFGLTYFPGEQNCLIFQWKNLFTEKLLLKCKNWNASTFYQLLSELPRNSTTDLIAKMTIFTLQLRNTLRTILWFTAFCIPLKTIFAGIQHNGIYHGGVSIHLEKSPRMCFLY